MIPLPEMTVLIFWARHAVFDILGMSFLSFIFSIYNNHQDITQQHKICSLLGPVPSTLYTLSHLTLTCSYFILITTMIPSLKSLSYREADGGSEVCMSRITKLVTVQSSNSHLLALNFVSLQLPGAGIARSSIYKILSFFKSLILKILYQLVPKNRRGGLNFSVCAFANRVWEGLFSHTLVHARLMF